MKNNTPISRKYKQLLITRRYRKRKDKRVKRAVPPVPQFISLFQFNESLTQSGETIRKRE